VIVMPGSTVRISGTAKLALSELAAQNGSPMSVVLERAIECYRRRCLLEEANAAYAALRGDPVAWQEELEERRAWDVALADGLSDPPTRRP
jgi:hypothetical protein